jgi:hypothetical protein
MSGVKYIRAKAIGSDEEWIPVIGLGDGIPGSGGEGTDPITLATRVAVSFTNTSAPALSDYQALYAKSYGEFPILRLRTVDADGNYIERNETPKFIMSGGLIDSIVWDLPDAESGYIIIS